MIPGLGRFPGGGHDNTLPYSCLENPMDRGAWLATVHVIYKESDMAEVIERACTHAHTHTHTHTYEHPVVIREISTSFWVKLGVTTVF